MALTQIDSLQQRIDAMEAMKRSLQDLVHQCHGDNRSACPILDDMASGGKKPAKKSKRA